MIICTWVFFLWLDIFFCLFVYVWFFVVFCGVFGFCFCWGIFFWWGYNTNLVTGSRCIGEEGDFLFYMRRRLGVVTLEGINTLKPYIFWALIAESCQSPHKDSFRVGSTWKLHAKPNHKSLKIYSLPLSVNSQWYLRAVHWLFPHYMSSLQQDQCHKGLTTEKFCFPVAAWVYLAYWANQAVFSSWRNRLEGSEKAAVFANTYEVPEVQNPTCEFLHQSCNCSPSKEIILKAIWFLTCVRNFSYRYYVCICTYK